MRTSRVLSLMRSSRTPLLRPALIGIALLSLLACSTADEQPDQGVGPLDGAVTQPDQSTSQPDAGACPAQTSGPTEHTANITSDETWRAADSPHLITGTGTLWVNNATLTIEPCATVWIDEGIKILVDSEGTLVAEGEADRPISFRGRDGKRWGNLRVEHPGSFSLAHVTLQDGGEDITTYDGATLVVWGDSEPPLKEVARVVEVTVEGSAGYGVLVGRWGGFTADSSGLTVTGSGAAELADCPNSGVSECKEPLHVSAQSLGTIPAGDYSGNALDEVLVNPVGGIEHDLTLRHRGLPYHVSGLGNSGLLVSRAASRPEDPVPTLKVEAGVTLAFDEGLVLRIGFNNSSGALQATGTSDKPVVFTSYAASPAAGDWRGLWFDTGPGDTASNALTHVTVAFAGGDPNGSGFSCPTSDVAGTLLDESAGITLHYRPESEFITNSTVSQSAGHGIVRGWTSDLPAPDFTSAAASNTFEQLAHCDQTNPKPSNGSCTGQICP